MTVCETPIWVCVPVFSSRRRKNAVSGQPTRTQKVLRGRSLPCFQQQWERAMRRRGREQSAPRTGPSSAQCWEPWSGSWDPLTSTGSGCRSAVVTCYLYSYSSCCWCCGEIIGFDTCASVFFSFFRATQTGFIYSTKKLCKHTETHLTCRIIYKFLLSTLCDWIFLLLIIRT